MFAGLMFANFLWIRKHLSRKVAPVRVNSQTFVPQFKIFWEIIFSHLHFQHTQTHTGGAFIFRQGNLDELDD